MEPARRSRVWTWTDVAILALFEALALIMVFLDAHALDALLGLAVPPGAERRTPPEPVFLGTVLYSAWPMLAVGGLGIAVATFRKPGDFRRRGMRGAGVVATALCAIIIVFDLVEWYLTCMWKPRRWGNSFSGVWEVISNHAEVAVLSSWVTLALAGRLRSETDWRDRLGRVLGWALIVTWAWQTFVHTQLVLS